MSTPIYPPQPQAAQPGAAFGVSGLQPMTVTPEALQPPIVLEQSATITPVPTEFKAGLRDRLRKRQPRQKLVDIGDGDFVLVRGMDAYAVERMQKGSDPDEDGGLQAPKSITESQPKMLRTMCFDPGTGESLFGTGEERQVGVDPLTDQPIIEVDGLTDTEINKLPMDVTNAIMEGINYVMGRGAEPGKDSPSTPDSASTSS